MSTVPALDMYTAPVDVNVKIVPGKVWEDKPAQTRLRPDKDMGVAKDIYVEDGKRKILRQSAGPSDEDEHERRINEQRKAAAAADQDEIPLKACQSIDLEDSSLFTDDLSYVEPKPEFPGPFDPERVRQLYANACNMLKIVPCSRYRHGLSSGRVIAGHQGMGPLGAKAVAFSLITNLTVTELHIPNNKLGPEGMRCMARLIHGNEVIKVLDISDNELGREGARVLASAIMDNDSIQQINAAGNRFDDKTGHYFEEALKINSMIKQLDMSRNNFCEAGAIAFAKGMEENYTVTHLDLSYNNIRMKGIRGIGKLLAVNHSLMQLDISWNGIDPDVAKVLGDGINKNGVLSVLNVSGCRMNAEGLMNLLGRMRDNKILKTLQIKDNPLTNADISLFLRAVECIPDTALSYIDASSVTISQEVLELVERIAKLRPGFMLTYRGLLSIRDQSKNMLEVKDLCGGDPLGVIISYARQKNLRLMDIFARFDVDKSGTMTRQELILGVADAGIPLSIKQLDKLVAKLDRDGDGEIDFAELLEGYRKFMRDLHRQGKVARVVLKGEADMFPGLQMTGGTDATTEKKPELGGARTSVGSVTGADIPSAKSSLTSVKRASGTVVDMPGLPEAKEEEDSRRSFSDGDIRQPRTLEEEEFPTGSDTFIVPSDELD